MFLHVEWGKSRRADADQRRIRCANLSVVRWNREFLSSATSSGCFATILVGRRSIAGRTVRAMTKRLRGSLDDDLAIVANVERSFVTQQNNGATVAYPIVACRTNVGWKSGIPPQRNLRRHGHISVTALSRQQTPTIESYKNGTQR